MLLYVMMDLMIKHISIAKDFVQVIQINLYY